MTSQRRGKYEKGVAALLNHGTVPAAAQALGITEVTLWRWLQDPEFERMCQEARRRAVSLTVARAQDAAPAAVEMLKRIMAARGSPVESKVAAARIILNLALPGTELDELNSRLAVLEEDERKQQQENAKGDR